MLLRLARYALALACCAGGACSYLITAPEATYVADEGMDAGGDVKMDAMTDAADGAPDGRPLEDATFDAAPDAPIDEGAMVDPEACESHEQCVAPADQCLANGFCNAMKRCEYTQAANCTECGELSVCVDGACRRDGVIYANDFESGALGPEWSTSPTRPWTITDTDANGESARSVMSGDVTQDPSSVLELTLQDIPLDARIDFWARPRGVLGYDTLDFYVRRGSTRFDEEEDLPVHTFRTGAGWQESPSAARIVGVTGEVTFTWRYLRTSSDDFEVETRAYVDDVKVSLFCP